MPSCSELPDGLIVLGAAPEILRNGDVHFHYRQSSDFLYLSGVAEPGCLLVLDPTRGDATLFVPRLTQQHAVWLGHIPSPREARERFGIRSVRFRDELETVLKARGPGSSTPTAAPLPWSASSGPAPASSVASCGTPSTSFASSRTRARSGCCARASAATAAGHAAAMRFARPGLYEYQVQAELERHFRHAGGTDLGYSSIIAGGRNSAVLHYHANQARLSRGELLLIDAGAEYRGYTADVTRTFPVSGRFTSRQRDVYSIVLEAQERCIDFARAGNTSMDWQRLAERRLAEGLRDLGLLKGSLDELLESEAVRVFFPHGIGHTLGLDVHDAQGGRRRRLRKTKAVRTSLPGAARAGLRDHRRARPVLHRSPAARPRAAPQASWACGLREGRALPRLRRRAHRGRRGGAAERSARESHARAEADSPTWKRPVK